MLCGFFCLSIKIPRPSIYYCSRSEERGPIMDTVLSFLISAGIVAFGVWVVAGTIAAGLPLAQLMGLLAAIVGLLSLFGSAQIAGAPRSVR